MAVVRVLPRPMRSLLTTAIAGLTVVRAGAVTAIPAQAAPSPGQVEAQIEAAWNKLETVIEQYNSLHTQYTTNKAKADALAKQIAPLRLQVDVALARVGAVSAQLYKHGPNSKLNALLASGSPSSFLEQLSTLNQIARSEEKSVASVVESVTKYNKEKQPLDALVALQQKQDADLAAQKASIEKQIADLQKQRLAAYGTTSGTGSLRPVPCPYEYIGGAAGKAVAYACSHIGAPYVWAAAGANSFDCSGLTLASWAAAGVSLYHGARDQKAESTPVARANVRPGDLVFFYSDVHHVGIVVGGGWMVHAPNSGDVVRMAKYDENGNVNGFGRPG
jgi:cell wall-associated NlpC family hydrolase